VIHTIVYLSMHTSPLLPPGSGTAGGMNVYIDELARTMAERGIDVTVFTRDTGDSAEVTEVQPGYRVVQIPAGPAAPIPMEEMPRHVGEFTEGTLKWIDANALAPDVIHSHYWLSGWAGAILKETLGVPLANSFHTLGRIKDLNRRDDEPASSPLRTLTEAEVIARSDCVIASTPYELDDLLEHYGALPERLCISPPGVDHETFSPGDRAEARRWLGLAPDVPIVLFVGRIQPLKGPDVAVDAMKTVTATPAPHLLLVGGPSGPDGDAEMERLQHAVASSGLGDRVHFVPPQPHRSLNRFYRAADVLVVPSRSETFGLVAAEAQACGLPVVAAAVGGLPYVVADGRSGLLVEGHDPVRWAAAIDTVLGDDALAAEFSANAVEFSERFSWPATAERLLELYAGIRGE
jgi:D-inositol-3-phosphate glycosyltransferase